MELALLVYFISIVGNIKGFFYAMCVLAFFGCIIHNIIIAVHNNGTYREEDNRSHIVWPFILLFIVGSLGMTLMPARDDAYKIAAAYGIQTVIENPKVQDIASSSVKVLEKAMDDYLNEGNK